MLNIERSKRLSEIVHAKPKECYLNAFRVLSELAHQYPSALYTEGFIIPQSISIVIEHGWIACDGQIVDPTLYHTPPDHYVPALQFTIDEAVEIVSKNRRILPISDYYLHRYHEQDPTRYETYKTARLTAYNLIGVDLSAWE